MSTFLGRFGNLPIRNLSLKRRRYVDDAFRYALKHNASLIFSNEIKISITREGNILIYIFGPRNSGKSEIAQSIALFIWEWLLLARGMNERLVFTRNYAETNHELANAGSDILTVIQDEDESLTGTDKITERNHFKNNLKTGRILKHNIIICSVQVDEELLELLTCSLETIGQDFNTRENLLMMYDTQNDPLGVISIKLHDDEELRNQYKEWKLKTQKKLAAQGGGRAVEHNGEFNRWVDKAYKKAIADYPGVRLKKQHFRNAILKLGLPLSIEQKGAVAAEAQERFKLESLKAQEEKKIPLSEKNQIVSEAVGIGHWWEDEFEKVIAPQIIATGRFDKYERLSTGPNDGLPDGAFYINSKPNLVIVVALEANNGVSGYYTAHKSRLVRERHAARLYAKQGKEVKCLLIAWNESTKKWHEQEFGYDNNTDVTIPSAIWNS